MAKKKPVAIAWPADETVRVPLKKLVPYARNARKHSPEQIAQIRASMREWGWTIAVLLDEKNGIIAGHGRVMAAAAELADGDKRFESVPCAYARGWSEAKKRAYIIADNKLALNADWDNDILRGELSDLANDGFDLDLTGWSEDELGDLMGGGGPDADLDGPIPDGLAGSKFGVIVECEDEAHQQRVYNEITAAGHKARVVSV